MHSQRDDWWNVRFKLKSNRRYSTNTFSSPSTKTNSKQVFSPSVDWENWRSFAQTSYLTLQEDHRAIRLTQCCTQFRSLGVKVLCVFHLHDNIAFTFKWYGNTWNKTFYSRRIWIGYNIELDELVYWIFSRYNSNQNLGGQIWPTCSQTARQIRFWLFLYPKNIVSPTDFT